MGRKKRKYKIIPDVHFTGMADKGRSIGRTEEGLVVFAEKVVPGDVADIIVFKKKGGVDMGRAYEITTPSPDRVEPFCEHFGKCGGCKWQNLNYEAQIKHKEIVVRDALRRIGKVEVEEFLPIEPAVLTTFYRNKIEFAFSKRRWLAPEELNSDVSNEADVLGFFASGFFDKILDINKCWLQPDPSNEIRNGIREMAKESGLPFFDIRENEGFFRNIMLRITTTGEVMVILSFYHNENGEVEQFLDKVVERFPQITSLMYCINPKLNDIIRDLDILPYKGNDYVEEQLGHVKFKIGPKSFFQTNTKQAKVLFDKVVEFADLQGTENVYDLYTGIGSIGLYIADKCKQVVGIEEVEAAIEDAKENAALNGIENAVFYVGDVKDILTPEFAEKHGKPDILITDPPRVGMHAQVVRMLLELEAPKIVYVSCNPATQARDLNVLAEKYRVVKVQPVDMFPHTHHIESVSLLVLKHSI